MNKNQFQISYFSGNISNLTRKSDISLERLHKGISTYQPFKIKVEFLREYYKKFGKQAYKELRAENLEYFMPSGVWSNRTKSGQLLKPSGLAQIDVDDISDSKELQRIKDMLSNDKHTALLFESPSGLGLKALVRVSITTPPRALLDYFQSSYGIKIDMAAIPEKQPCFVSYDPEAYLNLQAHELILEDKDPIKHGGEFYQSNQNPMPSSSLAPHVQAYCKKLIEQSANYLQEQPQGTGTASLNKAAYKLGRYAKAGLSKSEAAQALYSAFMSRKNHTENEFKNIFEAGWTAGAIAPNQGIIPDRPAGGYLYEQKFS